MEIRNLTEALEYIDALEQENRRLRLELDRYKDASKQYGRRKYNVQWQYTFEQVQALKDQGATTEEISKKLGICEKTVRMYVNYGKRNKPLTPIDESGTV